ncbi:MAG: hypothetical protein ACLRVE_01035 [Finegoldia magna]|uniref:hypothetical protein n=1 Tax=Finegoldia magna TaxID=1260 RepID=UPI000B916876|nr:hypothetical protein [Finegoldia magna]MDU5808214.1 hypothetical protein [Finegoldia magna]OXZ31446.1 hypothetical protein B9N57_01205 [Finegoldia magna]
MENSTFLASDYEKEQIDAIKKILRVYFSGDIEFSKNFSSLKPNIDNENLKKVLNELDDKITRDDLIRYVNDINIMAYNDENKLCFMYDANRKFTIERKTALENYPPEKNYGFCLDKWINKCDITLHNSSSDLQNAIYSSMLDICCEEMGILVVRICEDDFDWTDDHAMEKLNEIISNIRKGDFC